MARKNKAADAGEQLRTEAVEGPIRVDYVPLTLLRKAPRNPKQHDLGAIHESIDRFGFVQPILVRDAEDGPHIVAGHGRLDTLLQKKTSGAPPPERVMVKDGEWYVPVIRGVDFKDDNEAEAYLVADNQTVVLGGWDMPALADILKDHAQLPEGLRGIGFDSDDLDQMLKDIAGGGKGSQEGDGNQQPPPDQYMIVITCKNEAEQTDMLARFLEEGLECRALVS